MILRKPYAFLIRNFKLIHIILTILMILFFIKMRNIAGFLNGYVDENLFNQTLGVVSKYIGIWAFLLPIMIITILAVVMSLLKMKNKPVRFYWISIIAYIIEFIVMIIAYSIFNDIQLGQVSANFTSIFSELFDAISYLTLPFTIIALIRGVGFNVKQFNFKKDLIELDISDEDSEEFEVEVEFDTEDFKAKINRKLRFFKYVYLENKLVFISLGVISVIAIIAGIFIYFASQERIYNEKEVFKTPSLNLRVENSYKTKFGSNGSTIRKDKFYVIVDLTVVNTTDNEVSLPYKYIYLRVGDTKKYAPTDNYRDEFTEFGLRFISTDKIKPKEKRQVVLVYELDLEYEKSLLRFEYVLKRAANDDDKIFEYLKVDLKPKEFKEVEKVSESNLGDKLQFKNSLIEGTEIQIDEVEISKRFNHKYKQTIGGVEREFTKAIIPTDTSSYKKTIMKLKINLKKNSDLYQRLYSNFYEKYANIEYEINGKTILQKARIIDLTPENSEYLYLEVVEEISTANKVTLVFTIRDKEYRYILIDEKEETKEEEK